MSGPLGSDGRALIVAVDHPLYSWPCPGLEDRAGVLRAVSGAGADAIICSYGTLRDLRTASLMPPTMDRMVEGMGKIALGLGGGMFQFSAQRTAGPQTG